MDGPTKKIQLPEEETRRKFLVNAGKVAFYTPPVVMLLMHPSKDALAQSGKTVQLTKGWADTRKIDRW